MISSCMALFYALLQGVAGKSVMIDRLRWPVVIALRPYTALARPALDLSVRVQQIINSNYRFRDNTKINA